MNNTILRAQFNFLNSTGRWIEITDDQVCSADCTSATKNHTVSLSSFSCCHESRFSDDTTYQLNPNAWQSGNATETYNSFIVTPVINLDLDEVQ